jgi:hypothetical protein
MARNNSKIEDFAEELGKLLGTAKAKAEGWLGQRKSIAAQLATIRDTASELLHNLTESGGAVEGMFGPRRGHPSGSKSKQAASSAATGRRKRMSAAARAKISAAQKARWAKLRAPGRMK